MAPKQQQKKQQQKKVYDYSGLEKGMRVQAESDGTYYPAEVVQVSDSKNRAKAPVKISYKGYEGYDEWVGGDRLRSKALKAAAASHTPLARTHHPRNKMAALKKIDVAFQICPEDGGVALFDLFADGALIVGGGKVHETPQAFFGPLVAISKKCHFYHDVVLGQMGNHIAATFVHTWVSKSGHMTQFNATIFYEFDAAGKITAYFNIPMFDGWKKVLNIVSKEVGAPEDTSERLDVAPLLRNIEAAHLAIPKDGGEALYDCFTDAPLLLAAGTRHTTKQAFFQPLIDLSAANPHHHDLIIGQCGRFVAARYNITWVTKGSHMATFNENIIYEFDDAGKVTKRWGISAPGGWKQVEDAVAAETAGK